MFERIRGGASRCLWLAMLAAMLFVLPAGSCDNDTNGSEALEEMHDETKDAVDEIDDEIDDET